MKKEDFKIEIYEERYENNFIKYIPTIYRQYQYLNKFETFCNKFVPNLFNPNKIQHYSVCMDFGLTMCHKIDLSVHKYSYMDDAILRANLAIDTYLSHIGSKIVNKTVIHKIN